MGIIRESEAVKTPIAANRTRYLAYTEHAMMAVIDFNDGPHATPDPQHTHPHEQVSFVAEGDVILFVDGQPTRLGPGDMFTIPPGIPHCVQVLSKSAKLIDTFTPIREDFLKA